jgi:hypothetical protein
MSGNWLYDISGLIAVSAADIPNISSEVRFRSGNIVHGIRLADGQISSGESAQSEIVGEDEIFKDLAAGKVSLQAAYSAGKVKLSGDPEPLLRLAMVLSGSAAGHSSVEAAVG